MLLAVLNELVCCDTRESALSILNKTTARLMGAGFSGYGGERVGIMGHLQ